jgi:molybdate transport system ATP-binding protein
MSTTAGPLLAADIEVERRTVRVQASFQLGSGERLALFGPSGAGKTTILESIAGLTRLSRGTVRIGGVLVAGRARGEVPLPPRRRQVAIVRQPTTLFPHLTARENVEYGARGSSSSVEALLERLGLTAMASAGAAALSGGQRQRVALGRALASSFRVLLLDEPVSAVDVAARAELRELAVESATQRAAAGILVTHDLAEAQAFGGQLGIVDSGRVLEIGPSHEVVLRPAHRRVAELVGYGGFVPAAHGQLYAIHPDRALPGPMPDRGLVLTGTVRSVVPYGPRYECSLALGTSELLTVHLDEPPAVGAPCTITALGPPIVAS